MLFRCLCWGLPYEGVDEDCGDSWRYLSLPWLSAFLFSAFLLILFLWHRVHKIQDTIVWHALKMKRPHICTGSTPGSILVCLSTSTSLSMGENGLALGESARSLRILPSLLMFFTALSHQRLDSSFHFDLFYQAFLTWRLIILSSSTGILTSCKVINGFA